MMKYSKVFAALALFRYIFTFLIFFFAPSAFVSSTLCKTISGHIALEEVNHLGAKSNWPIKFDKPYFKYLFRAQNNTEEERENVNVSVPLGQSSKACSHHTRHIMKSDIF